MPNLLFHYTDAEGMKAIRNSGYIRQSTGRSGVAFFGNGVYLTAVRPSTSTYEILVNNYDDDCKFPPLAEFRTEYCYGFHMNVFKGAVEQVADFDNSGRDVWLYSGDLELKGSGVRLFASFLPLFDNVVMEFKKIKSIDISPNKIFLGAAPGDTRDSSSSPRHQFIQNFAALAATRLIQITSKFQIYSQVRMSSVPTVTSIDFLDNPRTDVPLLYKVNGNVAFSALNSKYTWEYAKTKGSKKLFMCKGTEEKGPLRTFTPGDDLNGAVIQLTCFPKNDGRKTKAGEEFRKRTQPLALPPVPFRDLIFQERARRLKPKAPATFRMVSYNVLAELLGTEKYFPGSSKDSLEIGYRLPLIAAELKAYNPDIVCLQEIEEWNYQKYLLPFLSQECGLDGQICVKLNEKPLKDGQATFFNTKLFEFVCFDNVVLADHVKILDFYDKLSDAMKGRFEELKHISQFCVLKTKHDSLGQTKLLLIANSHIYGRPGADHFRLLETMTILSFIRSKIQHLNAKYPNMKVVVLFAGDLNCQPESGSVRLLSSGEIKSVDKDWSPDGDEDKVEGGIDYSHNLNLTSAFPNEENTSISSTTKTMKCIDYVFYSERLQRVESYPPPTHKQLAEICRLTNENELNLPNHYSPSDHLPLIVDFEFKN